MEFINFEAAFENNAIDKVRSNLIAGAPIYVDFGGSLDAIFVTKIDWANWDRRSLFTVKGKSVNYNFPGGYYELDRNQISRLLKSGEEKVSTIGVIGKGDLIHLEEPQIIRISDLYYSIYEDNEEETIPMKKPKKVDRRFEESTYELMGLFMAYYCEKEKIPVDFPLVITDVYAKFKDCGKDRVKPLKPHFDDNTHVKKLKEACDWAKIKRKHRNMK